MQITSRKKRPVIRPDATRDAKLIVIATEGEITEEIYFNSFGNSRIKILTVPSKDGRSSPEYVCSNLAKFQEEYQLFPEDELWMVIDKDRWPVAKLHRVKSTCLDCGFRLAVSNPCFELWLAYHIDVPLPQSLNSRLLGRHLRSNGIRFKKNEYDPSIILRFVNDAVNRAKVDDRDPLSPWPVPHGSRVYMLMEIILNLSPDLRVSGRS